MTEILHLIILNLKLRVGSATQARAIRLGGLEYPERKRGRGGGKQ